MQPTLVTEFAPAKVNLTLHVTGQRSDGYHLLDSLVVFCGIGDWVTAKAAPALGLTITGPQSAALAVRDDNLVLRAANAFDASLGAALTLDKHLPVASGIGGGSANAAAALRALSRLWGIALPDASQVLALGADVPVCLSGKPARMCGIGDRVYVTHTLPAMHIVLVNPGVEVPTPAVFRALLHKTNPPMPETLPQWPDAASLADWLALQRNDLEIPACQIAPVIGDVLGTLAAQPGALIARMSGSGATCFGLFESDASAKTACESIAIAYPKWWAASGVVLP
jgi:4-diphosphocytidyl-2-C-methyl-D-erythritol kinase